MAEEVQAGIEQDATTTPPAANSGPGIMGLIKAFAFITVVVIVEVVAASMLIPSATDTEKLAKEIAAAQLGQDAVSSDDGTDSDENILDEGDDIREVLFGTYNVTRFNPEAHTTMTIDIEIYGSVLADEEGEFLERFDKHQGRVGEQVVMTLHGAETTELTDPALGLIKRRILEKTNRALGKPLVREVLISKFNFVER